MWSSWAIQIILKLIRIEIKGCPQGRSCISKISPETFRQQITTFLGQYTQQLLEGIKWFTLIKFLKLCACLCNIIKIKGNITKQRRIIKGIIPTPGAQILKIILPNKLESMQIKSKYRVEFLNLFLGLNREFTQVERRTHCWVLV